MCTNGVISASCLVLASCVGTKGDTPQPFLPPTPPPNLNVELSPGFLSHFEKLSLPSVVFYASRAARFIPQHPEQSRLV